jgi:hypothetical protein
MAPKRGGQAPDWLRATAERTRDPARGQGGPAGAERWAKAAADATASIERGEAPFGWQPAAAGASAEARTVGHPNLEAIEAQEVLTKYARTVLAMKPAGLDPANYTQIIRGRPVQAL